MKKKKKGRPSLLDLQKRNLKQEQEQEQQEQEKQQPQSPSTSNPNFNRPNRRSARRNRNLDGNAPAPEWIDGDGEGDDDDERKEKKVKLVVRLPPFNQHYHQPGSSANSVSLNSVSYGSDSNADGEDHEASAKKRKINAFGDRSGDLLTDQDEKVSKVMDTLHGSSLESGPTTPLPDKKLLVFILDRLQKKDTYGVFSEPVDPNELPDYHEIIEHPMDFGTVRKKLDDGHYPNLEEFEADILLICSNAMQYNASDTIYFRQARSIQELAKRDFENLRQVSDDGEPRPKVVRRGRPPSKNLKRSLGRVPIERVPPHVSADATVATGGDNTTVSNSYKLRKSMSERCQSTDALVKAFNRSRNNGTYADWSSEWNGEFPASILKAEAKFGKKQYSLDENRRATYNQSYASTLGHESSILSIHGGNMKQLIGVGLHSEHGYARSLARFGANLGPVAWKIVSKKLDSILPTGLNFGPGWVGENETPPQPPFLSSVRQKSSNNSANNGNSSRPGTPSTSGLNSTATYRPSFTGKEDMVEDGRGQSSQNDLAMFKSGGVGLRHASSFQTDQKHSSLSDRNGFNSMFTYGPSSQVGMVRLSMPTGHSGLEEATVPSQMLGIVSRDDNSSALMARNQEGPKFPGGSSSIHSGNLLAPDMVLDSCAAPEVGLSRKSSWQGFSSQLSHHSLPIPPDLNTRFQAPASPNSSFRIGSPQQPDLALQL